MMRIDYYERLEKAQLLEGVWQLLCRYDDAFIPPLSARENTYQTELNGQPAQKAMPTQYFETLKQQAFLIAAEGEQVIGFMSFRPRYICKDLHDNIETIYITTIIVDEAQRRKGITSSFYNTMLRFADEQHLSITTRTWSTNDSHIRVLQKIGLREIKRIKNGRGPNIDTVYFRKACCKGATK